MSIHSIYLVSDLEVIDSLIFDLSIIHHRYGSSSHVQQNCLLSHLQDLDASLRLAA